MLRWSVAVIAGVALALSSYVLLGAVMQGLWLALHASLTAEFVGLALVPIVAAAGTVAARVAGRHRGSAGMAVGVVLTALLLIVAARWPDAGGLLPYVVACLAGGAVAAWIGRRMH